MDEEKKSLISWEFWESERSKKTTGWYLSLVLVFVGLLVFAILTKSSLFLIFLVLFLLILVINWSKPIEKKRIDIYQDGIKVVNKFYEWDDLKNFSIVYQPKVKKLYLAPQGFFSLEFSVSLEEQNPMKIRNILKEFLIEDLEKKEETIFDVVKSWFRL